MNLYRVSIIDMYFKFKKVKPVYVVTKNKEEAISYVQKHLKDSNHKADKASHLGNQLATYMYSGSEQK